MKVVQIPNGVFAENCYLVVDEQARECAIVDPGEEAGLIMHKVEATGAKPVAIWLTHAHVDHVVGVFRIAGETGAPVGLHPPTGRCMTPSPIRPPGSDSCLLDNCRRPIEKWRMVRSLRSA